MGSVFFFYFSRGKKLSLLIFQKPSPTSNCLPNLPVRDRYFDVVNTIVNTLSLVNTIVNIQSTVNTIVNIQSIVNTIVNIKFAVIVNTHLPSPCQSELGVIVTSRQLSSTVLYTYSLSGAFSCDAMSVNRSSLSCSTESAPMM